jgi:hypothetical protein
MIRKKWLMLLSLFLLTALMSSCGVTDGRYIKRLPPEWASGGSSADGKILGKVKGEACVQILWVGPFPIPLRQKGDLENATKNALKQFKTLTKMQADHLVNVYQNESFLIVPLPIGYYERCTVVEGNAVSPSAEKTE